MAALVAQESGGDRYALDDDSTHIVYHPVSYAGAVRLAAQLIGAGHSVDLGLAQV
ncbi:conjugal transfer protein, partial [mine drainage metagenome]